jgi:aryl-alcohol dehydrogenase-like predicted oxidoreductase
MIDLEQAFNSKIGFGGAAVSGKGGGYGFGNIEFEKAVDLIQFVREQGITLFDSAPIYGFGQSEQVIGKAVSGNRENYFITSKSGITWDGNKRVDLTNEPKVTREMLEQSLRDLDTEYIDLYMVHWPDPRIDIRKPLEVLFKAKEENKIRYIGLANTNTDDYQKACEMGSIDVAQSQLNVFDLEVLKLMPKFKEQNTKFQSWGTLDKGILTKRVDKKREQAKCYDESDCRKTAPWWKQSDIIEKIEKLENIWPYLDENGISPLSWAIGHNLSFDGVDQVLIGMKNEKQCITAIEALKNLPTQSQIEELNNLIRG